ncbi:iron ABC transporter permease [Campylobacter sp. MIT 99-7217]|uniref:iron chelate uptake ABC transporter family permease subunit n=1 Tax=Campylobacter sp. MIT 99-7217 TaxID=535091 RepID=UPI00115AA52E|nr:iron chelate uptake ABC transporter family permease subunit [Campylobacter sp. MIT 99-7217]TQR34522.1 iron ABC transporter permease [Campylobacter sp. MIT 99-7217]
MLKKLLILFIITLFVIILFIFTQMGKFPAYVLENRSIQVLAMVVVGVCISVSTIIFQTIANNKILTPSIIGLDSLYMLTQTFLIFTLGSANLSVYEANTNFIISVMAMMIFTLLLYKILFKDGRSIYFILLLGFIFGTLFSSLSLFFEVLIDPDEFMVVQGRMFASFSNIQTEVLILALILMLLCFAMIARYYKFLDPLALNKDLAINLGIEYEFLVKRLMIIVAVLVSISTALVGPITFLGLLVANISYELMKTYKHGILFLTSSFISIITLVGGVFIVSRIFDFNTTISVIINFIGGIYFIFLVLKGNKI